MTTRLRPILTALVLVACTGEGPGTADGGASLDVCFEDAECGPGRICDGGVCRTGSRPNTGDTLDVQPGAIDLGLVQAGQTIERTVKVSVASGEVRVEKAVFTRTGEGPNELAIATAPTLPYTLRPGTDPLTITLSYTPADAVADAGHVVIALGDGGSRKVAVTSRVEGSPKLAVVEDVEAARTQLRSGNAIETLTLDFGAVATTAEKMLFLVNAGTGNAPLRVLGATLAQNTEFSIGTTPPSLPASLPVLRSPDTEGLALQAIAISIGFHPTSACTKEAAVVITLEGGAERTLPITGTRTATANEDADRDGKPDSCDPCPHDPSDDQDDDGICGDVDNCPGVSNADQLDADEDGRGDACDDCSVGSNNDPDEDGVCGASDNCPDDANATQADSDHDGVGDACDPCTTGGSNDPDADGVCGSADNCPAIANADQKDTDADGKGDACDDCTKGGSTDPDGDALCGAADNCPNAANANQADLDQDGKGDACDDCTKGNATTDADDDGVCTPADNCPAVANPTQANGDGDAYGDACDPCPNNARNDADGDGLCDETAPPKPDVGIYQWTRLNLPAGNLVAVDFAPDGSFFVALEANNVVHVVDWATRTDRKFDVRNGSAQVSWEDVSFDRRGQFAILAGNEFTGSGSSYSCCTVSLWKLDAAAARNAQSTQAQIFSRWSGSALTGEEAAAVKFPWGTGNPVLLTSRKVSSAYNALLREFDPASGSYVTANIHATATSAGCQDFAFTSDEFDAPSMAVACGVNGGNIHLWSPSVAANGGWRANSALGVNNLGNVGLIDSHRFEKYALVPNSSSSSPPLYRVARAQLSNLGSFPTTRMWGVRFQQLGQRALLFGSSFVPSGQYVAPVWEFRHPFTSMSDIKEVSITGFNVAPWPANQTNSTWGLNDVAFRPGCDGGVLVGGRADYTGSYGFFAQFQVLNGAACP